MSDTARPVPTANQLREGDLLRPDGVIGWRTVQAVRQVPDRTALEVELNGRTEDRPLLQFYGPDEEVQAQRPRLSPYMAELSQ